MTIFNIRIPGLDMKVVSTDGQNVVPVAVHELQIGNAETYDVIVTPGDQAYTFVAEAMDRSGMGLATLAPRMGMSAAIPPLRQRPVLTMNDMGRAALTTVPWVTVAARVQPRAAQWPEWITLATRPHPPAERPRRPPWT